MKNLIKKINRQAGMTYVELIVVLSIFAIMTSVVLFNYGAFQGKVDVKNLASDIALKIVEAQKSSNFGLLPSLIQQAVIINPSTWKPSYGFYANASTKTNFLYFVDLNQNGALDDSVCTGSSECSDKISITKGGKISGLDVLYQNELIPHSLNDLTVLFKRPNTGAIISSVTPFTGVVAYVRISVASSQGSTSIINVYPSGRIEVQ